MMDFNTSALLKALGVGAAVAVVLTIGTQIPIVGLVCCCVAWLGYGAVGISYGYFADQDGEPVDMPTWLLGGAAAGAMAGLVSGVVYGIVLAIFQVLGISAAATATFLEQMEGTGAELPPGFTEQIVVSSGFSLVSVLIAICGRFFLYALLATIGALIYALIKDGQQSGSTTAPAV
ncbi:MAG: hypothetical protein GYB64_15700 [Chloroflexi bacterium]|nr:hypothetical protein [Chloroflexota bacterium]